MENVEECGGSLKFVEVLLSAINVITGLLFPLLLIFIKGRGIL